MALPPLTPEQREQALAKAREARKERSDVLAALTRGNVTLAEVLADTSDVIRRTRARQVLTALPGIGPKTADRMLATAGVPAEKLQTRRLSQIGPNQRRALLDQVSA